MGLICICPIATIQTLLGNGKGVAYIPDIDPILEIDIVPSAKS